LPTVKQLLRGRNKYWQDKHSDKLSSIESLAWHAASQLCDFIQMTIPAEDLPKTLESTWMLLFGLEAYFKDVKELPPQSLALTMLLIERKIHGLDPHGDETRRVQKPD
jgi:hypothetical protein